MINSLHVLDEKGRSDTAKFLKSLAEARQQDKNSLVLQYPELFSTAQGGATAQKHLNELKVKILQTDDFELITLFQRSVRNHDTLFTEKADPVPVYYKHYQKPPFLIPEIKLTLDVQKTGVRVVTTLEVVRNSREASLVLDGRDHEVRSVSINGEGLTEDRYRATANELIISGLPCGDRFVVTICSFIDPLHNKSLEGLYACGSWLVTQCEPEGARRIFFTLDRPDVLSRFTTTIMADPTIYPQRLSNGNLIADTATFDQRACTIWEDPVPKPSYLFACVLGNLSKIADSYTTTSGKRVDLEVYVEPGKEQRVQYALFALKKAMEFDEKFFDREYDLNCLKMVGVPSFNSGAMENKGLLIFNDKLLLLDEKSGSDHAFRDVAHVVAHEYFHNWSGNRVTVRNWFEIALKEAFTDFRSMLFMEWVYGAEFIRPKEVAFLREFQFPEEVSEGAHPIMVESYLTADSIFDHTTYTKGREVFRTLQVYMDKLVPGGFRKAQNIYFKRYDGQAVTFRELLSACNEVIAPQNLNRFESWFHQTGTPEVQAEMEYDSSSKKGRLVLAQSNPHPHSKVEQGPHVIPFGYELLSRDGKLICKDLDYILDQSNPSAIEFTADEKPVPIFMHGYSAPVTVSYCYSLEDLACIVMHTDDPYNRWDAGNMHSLAVLRILQHMLLENPELAAHAHSGTLIKPGLLEMYASALQSSGLSPLAKAQLLQVPSLRNISQIFDCFDFPQLAELRSLFAGQLATVCKTALERLLDQYPAPKEYLAESSQMQVRELRNACYSLLTKADPAYYSKVYDVYRTSTNFNDFVGAFNILLSGDNPYRKAAVEDFHSKWHHDKAVFNYWLSSQASAPICRVEDLKRLMASTGFDSSNPNHIRSVIRAFINNLAAYHDPKGEGYKFAVDMILEVGSYNEQLAHSYLADWAFIDFKKLPEQQRQLMAAEILRLQSPYAPAAIRDFSKNLLQESDVKV